MTAPLSVAQWPKSMLTVVMLTLTMMTVCTLGTTPSTPPYNVGNIKGLPLLPHLHLLCHSHSPPRCTLYNCIYSWIDAVEYFNQSTLPQCSLTEDDDIRQTFKIFWRTTVLWCLAQITLGRPHTTMSWFFVGRSRSYKIRTATSFDPHNIGAQGF
jgi:hypothetical protein